MKKLLLVFIVLMLSLSISGCTLNGIDLDDTSHDDDYILVSVYYDLDVETHDVVKNIYVPTITSGLDYTLRFYTLDELDGDVENILSTTTVEYGILGNYSITSNEPIDIYAISDLKWESIPESAWYETPSEKRLNDDLLVNYGTLPILSETYQIGDVIRVIYQENNLSLHYMVSRSDTRLFIRYGDLRTLLV